MTHAPTRHLRPAKLKNKRYVKPYVLLEIEQLWCGHREVWTHGRAPRYHVVACRSKQQRWRPYCVIMLGSLISIAKVPAHMCCQRNVCRQVFDAFLT